MTVQEVISRVNDLKANDYDNEQKIAWLNAVESMIIRLIYANHEISETEALDEESYPYSEGNSDNVVLLVPEPWSDLYLYYLMMQIDFHNFEYEKYNANAELFNMKFENFAKWFRRTHMPKQTATHWQF